MESTTRVEGNIFRLCQRKKKGIPNLVIPILFQEVSGNVTRQNVPEHVLVVFPQLLHLVDLLLGLDAPQEVQSSCVLQLGGQGDSTL